MSATCLKAYIFLLFSCFALLTPSQSFSQNQFWNQSHIDRLNQELPRLDEDQVLFHWADPRRALRWIQNGLVDEGEVQFLNTPSGDRQVHGPGVYLSQHPTREEGYGEMLIRLRLRKGTPVYNNDVIRRVFGRDLNSNEQALLGNQVGYARRITSDWWTIHSASAARDVTTGIGHRLPEGNTWKLPVLMKETTPVTLLQNSLIELRDMDPKTFGYAASFLHLARYQDGISFLRSVQVNPQNPWSEFEDGAFESYRIARENLYRQVHQSWTLTDYGDSSGREPRFVRKDQSPIGISEDGLLRSRKLTGEEWAQKQIAILSGIRGQVSGNSEAPNRDNRIIAAGDDGLITTGKKQQKAMRVTESQLDELKANRFLKLQVQPDSTTGYFNVTIEYPSVYHWKRLQADLDPEFARELGNIKLAQVPVSSAQFKTLNQKFLDQLLLSTFKKYHGQSLDRAPALMRDLISIHPGADFNGRSIRLYLEAAEIESNRVPGYHFCSDLDLFTTPENYRSLMKAGGQEYALFQARALTEVVAARNEGRLPNLHFLPQDGESLKTTFRRSFESVGLPVHGDFSREQAELIRQRDWTKLLSKFGRSTFDLSDADSWRRAFNRYVKGTSGSTTGFREDILSGLPAHLAQGAKIDDETLREAIAISPARLKLAILKSTVDAKGISVAARLSALTQLMRGKAPSEYLKGRPEMLRLLLKEQPDLIDQKSIVALSTEIKSIFQVDRLSDYPAFAKILEKSGATEIVNLRAELILQNMGSVRAYSSWARSHLALFAEASSIYHAKNLTRPLKVALRAGIANQIDSIYLDRQDRRQILDSLDSRLRDELAAERLTRDAFLVSRNGSLKLSGRSSAAATSTADYYAALSNEARLNPDVQRAERVLARDGHVVPISMSATAGAGDEAAIAERAQKELRSLYGLLEVCDRKKKCDKSEITAYQSAWERLRKIDPRHPRLLNVLSWRPEDTDVKLNWNVLLQSVLEKPTSDFDQVTRSGLSAHLTQLLKRNEDRSLVNEVMNVAAHHGVINDVVLNYSTNSRLLLPVPEEVVKSLIAEHGLSDPRIGQLISRGHFQSHFARGPIVEEVRTGRLKPDVAFTILPSLKNPKTEQAIELIAAFKNYPEEQAILVRNVFSIDRNEYSSAYGILDRFDKLAVEVANHYRFTFEDITRALRASSSVSAFSQSRLMNKLMETSPELFQELVQRSQAGEDVSPWVRALGGSIENRTKAVKIVENVLKHDKEGKLLQALAKDVDQMSAADLILKGRPKSDLAKLEVLNPRLMAQLSLSDKELMESVISQVSSVDKESTTKIDTVDPKSLKPKYIRLCLAQSISVEQCRAASFDGYRAGSYHLSKTDQATLLEMALQEGNFDFVHKENLLGKLYEADADVSADAIRKLFAFIEKNPDHPLNSFYAHIFIERSSGNGRIFLTPAEHWRLTKTASKSKQGLRLTKVERAMDMTFRMIGNPITGPANKIGRGCQSLWEKVKSKLK